MPDDCHRQTLRFPPEVAERLRAGAKAAGVRTVNGYALRLLDEGMKADEAARRSRRAEKKANRTEAEPAPARGLGLGLRIPRAPEPPPPPAYEPPPPVVVNVGNAPSANEASGDRVAWLVAFVAAATSTFERERRLRQAEEVLRPSCKTSQECEDLMRKVKAAVQPQKAGGWSLESLFR